MFDGGGHDENVDASFQSGADHLAPFRAFAGEAGFALAVACQMIFAVPLFEGVLDFLRAVDGLLRRILDAVKINAQRNDVPLERPVFAERGVIAHDRSSFIETAETELYRTVGANS